MQTIVSGKRKLPAIEYCRILASVFVVFIHFEFPGVTGDLVSCLARFAVPFFFILSGYFAYPAEEAAIKKRILRVLKINLYATALYILWGSYKARYVYQGSRLFWLMEELSIANLAKWIFNNVNPFAGHLWYLSALLVCYLVLFLSLRWMEGRRHYQPLYTAGFFLYSIHFVLSTLSGAADLEMPILLYRNALLFGFPMFVLGIFLHNYQEKLIRLYRLTATKLVLLVLAGIALSILQWVGIGRTELPVGTLLEAAALLLLLIVLPQSNKVPGFVSRLGDISTYVYVTHPFWGQLYSLYGASHLDALGQSAEAWLRPVIVVLISVLTGILWTFLKNFSKRKF